MSAIRRPGVEVTQEFVTESPSILEPSQAACIVGPCYRIVDAFDDEGEPQSEALAGTYRDGYGTISYDIPGLEDDDSLTSLTDEIRVFLVVGSTTTELNSSDDEETILSASDTGSYLVAGPTFSDAAADFVSAGVEADDVVRFTYQGKTYDIWITSVSTTSLVLDSASVPEDVFLIDYSIIRSPTQFVYSAGSNASVAIGTVDEYLTVSGVNDLAASAGDGTTIVVSEAPIYESGTLGASGDCVFMSAGSTFAADVGEGEVSDTFLFAYAAPLGNENDIELFEVLAGVDDGVLIIESGLGVELVDQDFVVGTELAAGTDAVEGGAGANITSALSLFNTAGSTYIPNTAGTPDAPTYIELDGEGIYEVVSVDSDTVLEISPLCTVGIGPVSFRVISEVASGADGATGATTDFVSSGAEFVTSADGLTAADLAIVVDGDAYSVASITSEGQVVLADPLVSGNGQSWDLVTETLDIAVAWDDSASSLAVTMGRTAGITSGTLEGLSDAMDALEAAAERFDQALTGAGSLLVPVGTYTLDGGADNRQLVLDADLIGGTTPTGRVYVSYKALRLDVTAAASDPALLSFDDTDDLEDQLTTVTTANPLALGVYFALLNSSNQAVKGLGVSEISATKPMGTLDAYIEALEFLEGQDIYCLAPLTQDPSVLSMFQVHVDDMSEPEAKSERITFLNLDFPTYSTAETVGSGTEGNTGAAFNVAGTQPFTTATDFTDLGIEAGDILVVSSLADTTTLTPALGTQGPLYGLVVVEVTDGDSYSLDVTVPAGLSDDWNSLVDVSFTVYRSGSALTTTSEEASAIEAYGPAYEDRRVVVMWPDACVADVDGTSSVIDGYYLACAWAGKLSGSNPGQGFTNMTVAGFTGLKRSNGYFSEPALNEFAGSGLWVNIQESSSAPIKCRHQLSTDVSSIQRREVSITRVIDYVAKFLRIALSKKIGKFNITQSFLDSLATQVQGLGRYLVDAQILKSFKLTSLAPDADQVDTVNITVLIEPFYPCNYIALTVQV